nr:hypothetical protein [Tanacetum cinerariifolium]
MTNKINTFLKAINGRMMGALPSDTVKTLKLNVNLASLVSYARSYPMEDPKVPLFPSNQLMPLKRVPNQQMIFKKTNYKLKHYRRNAKEDEGSQIIHLAFRLEDSNPFNTLADLRSYVNLILFYLFKKHKIGLLKETNHIFGIEDETRSYPVGIVKNVEVHIGKLKLLEDFYVIDMQKDPICPLLIGRGVSATASIIIDCKKAKIAVGKGITRSIFRVKEIDQGARPPHYVKKDFMNHHLSKEWEIARDAKLNPFKDVLVFRKMVEFLRSISINLKGNMWELKELIENKIDRNKPPKKEMKFSRKWKNETSQFVETASGTIPNDVATIATVILDKKSPKALRIFTWTILG